MVDLLTGTLKVLSDSTMYFNVCVPVKFANLSNKYLASVHFYTSGFLDKQHNLKPERRYQLLPTRSAAQFKTIMLFSMLTALRFEMWKLKKWCRASGFTVKTESGQ